MSKRDWGNLLDEWDSAAILFAADCAKGRIEEELSYLIGEEKFDDIGHDYYDRSIEVMVAADAEIPTGKFIELCAGWGFVQGWINFSDGTESHFSVRDRIVYERKAVPHPRWTEERRRNFREG